MISRIVIAAGCSGFVRRALLHNGAAHDRDESRGIRRISPKRIALLGARPQRLRFNASDSIIDAVTAEVAGSSPVVHAVYYKDLWDDFGEQRSRIWVQAGCISHPVCTQKSATSSNRVSEFIEKKK